MRLLLAAAMALLLIRPETSMTAVRDSCRLFVTAVMPGLLPYMVFSSMLLSRVRARSAALLTLLGWCGGSPGGARLLKLSPGMTARERTFISVATATMSPMFLVGTCGGWLGSARAGVALLISVLAGGAVAGTLAAACCQRTGRAAEGSQTPMAPLTLGASVEQTARTLLMVCGTMAMARLFAALAAEALPAMALPLTTLLEVTAGVHAIAELPLPLAWRTALIAAATGFGGMAILLQNRTAAGEEALPLWRQLGWQAVHGIISGLLALGLMLLWDG